MITLHQNNPGLYIAGISGDEVVNRLLGLFRRSRQVPENFVVGVERTEGNDGRQQGHECFTSRPVVFGFGLNNGQYVEHKQQAMNGPQNLHRFRMAANSF